MHARINTTRAGPGQIGELAAAANVG